jgi:hypothetical protein
VTERLAVSLPGINAVVMDSGDDSHAFGRSVEQILFQKGANQFRCFAVKSI